ncbi:maker228 [Drosophila busckii]|uniref:Maker228 n=1 Tax=Drosophila busckii TaxID=30019 RepID=A0A0M4F6K0_DROBS|nr:maker228 [Drosophila busckii]
MQHCSRSERILSVSCSSCCSSKMFNWHSNPLNYIWALRSTQQRNIKFTALLLHLGQATGIQNKFDKFMTANALTFYI